MSRFVGYTRDLLPGVDVADDILALQAAGASEIIRDSTADVENPSLASFSALNPGDVVLVTEGARLAGSVLEFTSTVTSLTARGVHVRVLSEPALSTGTSGTDPADVLGALTALHSRLKGLRTKAGMSAAAAAGRRLGRPPVMTTERLEIAHELRSEHRSYAHIARVLGVSTGVVWRALSSTKS